jgi:peptide/nickel transport system permease protein
LRLIRLFMRNKLGLIGASFLAICCIVATFPSFFAPQDPELMNIKTILQPPSREYLLGTDEVGRGILSRVIYGDRISLLVGFAAAGLSTIIGVIVGIIAGYYGGRVGEGLMRATDLFIAIPRLPLMLVLAAIVGPSIWNIILIIGLLLWTQVARIVRAKTLSVREYPFIERSKAIGCSDLRIMAVHILPNVVPLVLANAVLLIGTAIYYEVTVSFLGLGDPTHISWGMILHSAFSSVAIMHRAYWYVIPPGLAIVLTVLSFTFVGHALDEVLNPKLRER